MRNWADLKNLPNNRVLLMALPGHPREREAVAELNRRGLKPPEGHINVRRDAGHRLRADEWQGAVLPTDCEDPVVAQNADDDSGPKKSE